MRTIFKNFAVHKLPNFPVQDRLEVRLALLGSLPVRSPDSSLEWLKEHTQPAGFNQMIASCLPKMASKSKLGQNKANFVQKSNRITVI